ncbi:hypothetical protein CS022_10610 [Veronia nyctiphanis]|uniref:Protein BatD n=1 Tax=Veronia nyctiphanis TaxID=1278244 RepID=A0A4Q0YQA5_9GAMM|nr:BatD family protein [Veronia nyctiphanis]RXJ73196.1 hypothetical protein CS022_10610 [Veronia nyctiphanis]
MNKWRMRRSMHSVISVLLLCLISVGKVFAADAIVTDNVVSEDQTIRLTVQAEGTYKRHILNLSPLKKDFYVGKVNSNVTSRTVAGKETLETVWRVTIGPKRTGKLRIPALKIGSQRTESITIEVLPRNSPALKKKQSPATVQTSISRKRAYIGEVLTYKIKVFIRTNLTQTEILPPSGNKVDVTQQNGDVKSEELVNGIPQITVTRTYLITPKDTGNVRLTGASFKGFVVKNGGVTNVPLRRKGNDILLSIKPPARKGVWLPASSLSLSQSWQSDGNDKVKVGDAITRVIELKAKGLAQSQLPEFEFDYPSSVRVYDEKPTYKLHNGYTVMSFKQVLIPRAGGTITLPGLSLRWWNTNQDTVKTTKIPAKKIVVNGASGALPEDTSGESNNDQANTLFAGLSDVLPTIPKNIGLSLWQFLTVIFAILWVLSTILWLRSRKQSHTPYSPSPIAAEQEDRLTSLYQAAVEKDAVKIGTLYPLWARSHLPVALQKSLDAEIDKIQDAAFCPEKKSWSNKALLKLLKKAQSSKNLKKMASSLAPLEPG